MPFKKGASGNPAGRPRGIQTQAKLRKAIEQDLPDILRSMVELARTGDVAAARLLLDRTLPSLKAVDAPAPLALGDGPADLAGAATAVLAALSAGSLTPDQAGAVASVLNTLVRVREATDLEARITKLENRSNGNP
jgi:hypothetical protein